MFLSGVNVAVLHVRCQCQLLMLLSLVPGIGRPFVNPKALFQLFAPEALLARKVGKALPPISLALFSALAIALFSALLLFKSCLTIGKCSDT